MKTLFKSILKYYLKYITKLALLIHRPFIIGVSGSINVVFVKDEIGRQLAMLNYEVRSNPKNFNTEIGLPLAILNLPSGYNLYKKWLPIIWQAGKSIFTLKLPKILVLGLGISCPGDMKYLLSLVKPKIAVITDITQRYLESFEDMDELVGEYEMFAKSIPSGGYLILNYDNERIKKLSELTKNKTFFFSLKENRDKIKNYWQGSVLEKSNLGQRVRVLSDGLAAGDYEIKNFGQHHLYAFLCGVIVKKIILNPPYEVPEG